MWHNMDKSRRDPGGSAPKMGHRLAQAAARPGLPPGRVCCPAWVGHPGLPAHKAPDFYRPQNGDFGENRPRNRHPDQI